MSKVYGAVCGILIILSINNFYSAATNIEENGLLHYDIHTDLPVLGRHVSFSKLRAKRETTTDLKTQYQAVSENGSAVNSNISPATAAVTQGTQALPDKSATNSTSDRTIPSVVTFNGSDQALLGVNGTGQRKDVNDKQQKLPKKVQTTMLTANDNDDSSKSAETLVDEVDVPENDTMSTLEKHHVTNVTTDHHEYYNSTIYYSETETKQIWDSMKNVSHNQMLSESHRRAMTVDLSFDFPFYGHPVRKITVATGGFIYTGEYVHSWLAATQYIASLMANFDTSISDDSFVRFNDNGTAFTVIWENVSLQDKQDVGKFTFSTTLFNNGDITFAYLSVPIQITAIQDSMHPVKVGLSDAYIVDKTGVLTRRKTIYEYHRANFANTEIKNSTIIRLTALPTCLQYTDCAACMNHETVFKCLWCPSLNRCSTGSDRKAQEWTNKGCDRSNIGAVELCPALGEKGNNANQTNIAINTQIYSTSTTQAPTTSVTTPNTNSNNNNTVSSEMNTHSVVENPNAYSTIPQGIDANALNAESKSAADGHTEPKSVGIALGFLIPICLVMTIFMWVVYAYRNPHTKSGQLLIQYRPSQWSWRRGEARYTAATIHM